jgi:hypothetical protein
VLAISCANHKAKVNNQMSNLPAIKQLEANALAVAAQEESSGEIGKLLKFAKGNISSATTRSRLAASTLRTQASGLAVG